MADEISTTPAGPGQVESLDNLATEARALDQVEQLQGGGGPVATAQQLQAKQEAQQLQQDALLIAGLLGQIRNLAGAMAEEAGYLRPGATARIWTDQALQGIAGPLVQIMQRHGGDLSQWMQQYGPYLALIAAAAMPAGMTLREVREARAARQPAGPTPAPQPEATT